MNEALTLEDAIRAAGSPMDLIWTTDPHPWAPPVVPREVTGWADEQRAWHDTVAFSDLSHHMSDAVLAGPDALRLLSEHGVNNFNNFAIGQAKQFVPVNEEGLLISDAVLLRDGEERFTLTGNPAAAHWLMYRAGVLGYDIDFAFDPDSALRGERKDPVLFRYQLQGPNALELASRVFETPVPAELRFFHSASTTVAGRRLRALRHGMAGQAGFELIGAWPDGRAVREAILAAGAALGLKLVGALAYSTNGVESGWLPAPLPAIYAGATMADYRASLPARSYEGNRKLHGSYYSEDIRDYFLSPHELDYGRLIHFDHDFYGREALRQVDASGLRRKVVLELQETAPGMGRANEFFISYGRFRVEKAGAFLGYAAYTARVASAGKVLALSLLDPAAAEPGTRVDFVWGDHPGRGGPDNVAFETLSATVHPSPYSNFARTRYRENA